MWALAKSAKMHSPLGAHASISVAPVGSPFASLIRRSTVLTRFVGPEDVAKKLTFSVETSVPRPLAPGVVHACPAPVRSHFAPGYASAHAEEIPAGIDHRPEHAPHVHRRVVLPLRDGHAERRSGPGRACLRRDAREERLRRAVASRGRVRGDSAVCAVARLVVQRGDAVYARGRVREGIAADRGGLVLVLGNVPDDATIFLRQSASQPCSGEP